MKRDDTVGVRKRIVLIAHDNRKSDLLAWATFHRGPLGGDQQVGAAIAEGRIDAVIFLNPLEPHPHDVDVKALLRIAVVCNIPIACNRATADFVLSSPLMGEEYHRAATA